MKLASISVFAFSLLMTAAVMGCSSGGGRPHSTDTGVHGPMDSGVVPRDTGGVIPTDTGGTPPRDTGGTPPRDTGGTPPRDSGGGSTCSATCTTSSDCASACGAVPGGGTRCCDTSTMRCFVSHSTCPAAGGGDSGAAY